MDLYGATKTKYDVPLNHLDFSYVKSCTDKKELEKIVKILRCVVVISLERFVVNFLKLLVVLECIQQFVYIVG